MKLNIITAASNSVGQAIGKKIANTNDITLGLSRRGSNIENVQDIRVTDLSNVETTRCELHDVLSGINPSTIDGVRLFHNCGLAKYEFPAEMRTQYPALSQSTKFICEDADGDGIDDGAYNALVTTFRNIFSLIQSHYPNIPISIGTICSLMDKRKYDSEVAKQPISSTVFSSMIKSNRILRNELDLLSKEYENVQSVCVSAATIKTETEQNIRKHSLDQEYWVTPDTIASVLVEETEHHRNEYKDIDVFVHHPRRADFVKETDEDLTKRQIFDITGMREYP